MKTTQRFSIAFSFLTVALMSAGCASDCGSRSGTGLFGTNILQGQPVRSTVRSWFQGDSCDTCNTPAGQLSQSLAPACENCASGVNQVFGSEQQVQPLYGAPSMNAIQADGFSGQFAPQPGPAVGSSPSNLGSLASPPSL